MATEGEVMIKRNYSQGTDMDKASPSYIASRLRAIMASPTFDVGEFGMLILAALNYLDAVPDLLKVLEAVEWIEGPEQCPDDYCPWCGNMEFQKEHAPTCERQQAIKKARGE